MIKKYDNTNEYLNRDCVTDGGYDGDVYKRVEFLKTLATYQRDIGCDPDVIADTEYKISELTD